MSLVHMKDAVWKKAKKIRGKDPKKYRQDPYGNEMATLVTIRYKSLMKALVQQRERARIREHVDPVAAHPA